MSTSELTSKEQRPATRADIDALRRAITFGFVSVDLILSGLALLIVLT